MMTQYAWIALALTAAYFGWNYIRSRGQAVTTGDDPPASVVLKPKVPTSADSFAAVEVLSARLEAVGLPAEEIAAIRRPILEQISKPIKQL